MPNEVIVRETDTSAYVYKATLKVLLEEDYLKSSQLSAFGPQQYNFKDGRLNPEFALEFALDDMVKCL